MQLCVIVCVCVCAWLGAGVCYCEFQQPAEWLWWALGLRQLV